MNSPSQVRKAITSCLVTRSMASIFSRTSPAGSAARAAIAFSPPAQIAAAASFGMIPSSASASQAWASISNQMQKAVRTENGSHLRPRIACDHVAVRAEASGVRHVTKCLRSRPSRLAAAFRPPRGHSCRRARRAHRHRRDLVVRRWADGGGLCQPRSPQESRLCRAFRVPAGRPAGAITSPASGRWMPWWATGAFWMWQDAKWQIAAGEVDQLEAERAEAEACWRRCAPRSCSMYRLHRVRPALPRGRSRHRLPRGRAGAARATRSTIVTIFEADGAHAKVSPIHVNGWFGDDDKLTTSRMLDAGAVRRRSGCVSRSPRLRG